MNVNLPLTLLVIVLAFYAIALVKKFKIRNAAITTKEQSLKDQYTKLRRSAQWVYDHLVFPVVNIFNMAAFFCTFLYLQSLSAPTSSSLD